jgi:hypothetical protein
MLRRPHAPKGPRRMADELEDEEVLDEDEEEPEDLD